MTTYLIANKEIAIIGGGPVGLTTARLLQQAGGQVAVYERDRHPAARMLGGSLDIQKATGQRALAKAGLLEAFYALARPSSNRMADKHGLVRFETLPNANDPYEAPEIDRPELRNLLLNSLAANTVQWDRHTQSIEKDGDRFTLHFQNGATATADLVIIADGTMSKARKFITAQLPEYTGTYLIQGEVFRPVQECPAIYALANGGNLGAIEDKKALFLHSKGNGHLSFYASAKQPGSWLTDCPLDFQNRPAVAAFLHDLFAGWGAVYHELFDAADEYLGYPLRAFVLDEPWQAHGNITLVGDAAHAMPPFGGQGVNMGLVDALNLAENLTDEHFADIPAAIAAYEQRMFGYAKPVQHETLAANERIHNQSETPEERAVRVAKIFASRQLEGENNW